MAKLTLQSIWNFIKSACLWFDGHRQTGYFIIGFVTAALVGLVPIITATLALLNLLLWWQREHKPFPEANRVLTHTDTLWTGVVALFGGLLACTLSTRFWPEHFSFLTGLL